MSETENTKSEETTDEPKPGHGATPVDFRIRMIRMGLEMELRGMRLTGKAPPCFTIIRREFGIKAKRGPGGKRAAYVAFCDMFGFTPKPEATPIIGTMTINGTADPTVNG